MLYAPCSPYFANQAIPSYENDQSSSRRHLPNQSHVHHARVLSFLPTFIISVPSLHGKEFMNTTRDVRQDEYNLYACDLYDDRESQVNFQHLSP